MIGCINRISRLIEHKTFLEDGPIVLKRIDDEDYMQIPLFRQVAYLCETIGAAKALKLTAIGNLPRAVVHEIYNSAYRNLILTKIWHGCGGNRWYTVPLTRLWQKWAGLLKSEQCFIAYEKG